jgi:lipase chaperone LimK
MTTRPRLKAVLNLPTPCRFVQVQSPLLEYIMQVTNDTVTQQHLDAVHEAMRQATQLWVSGLITDKEVADHFAKLATNFQKLEQQGLLSGLLDPATGLKY